MLLILGVGLVQLGLFSRTYAVIYLGEHDEMLERGWNRLRLEHGLALSACVFFGGVGVTLGSFFDGVRIRGSESSASRFSRSGRKVPSVRSSSASSALAGMRFFAGVATSCSAWASGRP